MAYELIQSVRMNQDYTGHAEEATWEFTVPLPEQLAQWPADLFINAHIDQLASQNSRLLELRVWRDIAPDFTTNYRVVTIATASPLFWTVIIVGILVVIGLGLLTYTLVSVKDLPMYMAWTTWGLAIGAIAIAVIVIASTGKGES